MGRRRFGSGLREYGPLRSEGVAELPGGHEFRDQRLSMWRRGGPSHHRRLPRCGQHFIDTANVYTSGQSEEVVGRAIKARRESVVLATKGRGPQGTGPNDVGLSRVSLTRALEASLRRLDTDYVDLYQCHAWDSDTPIEETMSTLDGFVRSGKVRYIGCSNFDGAQIV